MLKDFRRSLALVRVLAPGEGLLGFSTEVEEVTELMWEPAEQRKYALRWLDPNNDPTKSVPIANVLAFVGLSFFPLVPSEPDDRTTGFDPDESSFLWPLWEHPLSIHTAESLLASRFIQENADPVVRSRGVITRFKCAVIMADKRNYFSPSRPV